MIDHVQLTVDLTSPIFVVSSNATWALGQIVEAADLTPLIPYVNMIVQQLCNVILSDAFENYQLKQNNCITLVSFRFVPVSKSQILRDDTRGIFQQLLYQFYQEFLALGATS